VCEENIDNPKLLCKITLKAQDIEKIQDAVEELYYFEFVADELPMRGFIGHLEETGFLPHSHHTHLWTHLHFQFLFNGNHIISANVSTSNHPPLSIDNLVEPANVTYSYTVKWTETKVKYKQRSQVSKSQFFQKSLEIHWLSIVNSVILVVLLLGFVIIILMRVLKNDLARYNLGDVQAHSDDLGEH
jgi:transmembrane 9 superfamily protein 1